MDSQGALVVNGGGYIYAASDIYVHVYVSNQGNPAARHCTGMSAAGERGMVTRIMRLYEGYGDLYIHGSQVVRSVKIKELRNTSSH